MENLSESLRREVLAEFEKLENQYSNFKEIPFGYRSIREEKDCNDQEKQITEINVGIYYFHATVLKSYIPKITNKNQ